MLLTPNTKEERVPIPVTKWFGTVQSGLGQHHLVS